MLRIGWASRDITPNWRLMAPRSGWTDDEFDGGEGHADIVLASRDEKIMLLDGYISRLSPRMQ